VIDWGTVKPVIKALVQDLITLDTLWEDEPRTFNPGALCLLQVLAVATQGWDERRIIQDLEQAKGEELQDLYVGNRLFTLTVKVESLIQTDTDTAYQHLERFRGKLNFRSVTDRLHAVNCAWIKTESTVDLTAIQDDRNRSIAAVDVHLSGRFTVLDATRFPYIETADVNGALL
jgi:hypothetical protein